MADGQSVSAALDVARLELLMDNQAVDVASRAEHDTNDPLQDWFVPVLYQQASELGSILKSPYPRL